VKNIFETKIEFLKGIGPDKAKILGKDFGIFTFGDFLEHFPYRYEDKTKFYNINELTTDLANVKVKGKIRNVALSGTPGKQRLNVLFEDHTGQMELVWFKGINWVQKIITIGKEYVVFGKPTVFKNRISISHPEIETVNGQNVEQQNYLTPVYHTSEVMKKRFLDSKAIAKSMKALLIQCRDHFTESLPSELLKTHGLIGKREAVFNIHFPKDTRAFNKANARLKFEELFFIQLKLLSEKSKVKQVFGGIKFKSLARLKDFYNNHLPFDLTNAQKRVIKEIRDDVVSGKQMNRLLQGDVGSGKTIVAFICMLMAVDNDAQSCLMAPTEILAEQHFAGLLPYCESLGLEIKLLTGSSKTAARREIDEGLRTGKINILVGTHALLEDKVVFKNLGLAVMDEQHRFGVAQRAKLWTKNTNVRPHILVMTATPIPRTLAMTVYGDLDVSIIDELPAGRKPIQTIHKYQSGRLRVQGMVKKELDKGRQAYIVYPLIEESEKLELKNLIDGYHDIVAAFPNYHVSIVHGRLTPQEKESEMKRFVAKETQIMVATTVIEVGVNVPNATVMVIENAERFGLAQLHQLRGRVGRGAEQSFCVLVTGNKLSKDGKTRMETMVRTTNGFEIADVDLRLRGPGDMSGTQQSGVLEMKLANLAMDGAVLAEARKAAEKLVDADPELNNYPVLKNKLNSFKNTSKLDWSLIS